MERVTEIMTGQVFDESALVATLARHAPDWLSRSEPGSASVVDVQTRTQSVLIRAEIGAGAVRAPIMVKIPLAAQGWVGGGFRLADPVFDPREKSQFEYATLAAVDAAVTAAGDERFGRARAFGHIPEMPAVVLGVVDGQTLDRILPRGRRPGPHDDYQLEIMSRTGALLSIFHSAATEHMVRRDNSFDEVASDVFELLKHLRSRGKAGRQERRVQEIVARFGSPTGWPSDAVMAHGDFAPRNIFVGEDLRVTTVDSLGRFQVPPHEDMAYLLTELATGSTRFARPGLPWSATWVRRLRGSLLAAYPMEDDPVLWLFEIRSLLDKWRSLVDRAELARSGRSASRDRFREALVEREITRLVKRLGSAF